MNKIIRRCPYLFIMAAIFFSTALAYGKVSARASLDKKNITIGDDLKYTFSIDFPAGYNFNPPDFQTIFSNFEIRSQKTEKSKKHIDYKYILTAYTTGEIKINSFEMEFTSTGGEKEKITLPEIAVAARFLEPGKNDTSDIRDIKPPIMPPLNPLIYVAVVILLSAAVYYFFLRKSVDKIVKVEAPAVPALSPEESANRRLAELEAKKLAEQGLMKEFYIELSDIVRAFLADKYGVPVIERTTDELFNDLKKLIAKKKNLEIREFLEASDMVKFAKYIPGINESRNDFERAGEIINSKENEIC